MTFPTSTINTTNLDSATDSPASARADLLDLVEKVNTIISERNTAQGVLVLDSSGQILTSQLPSTQSVTGTLILNPTDKIVNVRTVLRLQPIYTEDLLEDFTASRGDLAMTIDGDAGNPALACYDGTAWRIIEMRSTIGSVSAALSFTASLAANPDN